MRRDRPMRVLFLGLRGFPEIQGGVETHAEHLCLELVKLGCHVEVITRSNYMPAGLGSTWRGVKYVHVWAPRIKEFEAVVHTFLGVIVAAIRRPDILHIHAIGPALMVPLARILGLRVVVTHHGPDYDRQKWGRIAKWWLRKGEQWGMRWSSAQIAISKVIGNDVRLRYDIEANIIPNGVKLPELPRSCDALQQFGLVAKRYVLLVGRLVPEKRHLDLLHSFERAGLRGWKLVFVGASDHPDSYQRDLVSACESNASVVMTGFQSGLALQELFASAGLFVLPSSHEGLPIALLEALSYGLRTIASNIPANLEVGLPDGCYFPLGDTSALAALIKVSAASPIPDSERRALRAWVADRYDWHRIALETLEVYRRVARNV